MTTIRKVFITGGGGSVGRAVVRRFLDNQWQVTTLSHPSEVHRLPFSSSDGVDIVVGELNSIEKTMIPSGSTVVHLAAKVHTVPKTREECDQFFYVNRDGTIRLGETALERDVRAFVFVSTSGVYGNAFKEGACDETTPVCPTTPYTQSKWEAEQRLTEILQPQCPLIIFRPSVMFGPYDRGNFNKLFRMLRQGLIPLIAGGRSRKSILYSEDFASLLEFAASHVECFNRITYNAASMNHYSFRELCDIVVDVTGQRAIKIPLPTAVLKPLAWCGDFSRFLSGKEFPFSTRKLEVLQSDSILNVSKLYAAIQGRLLLSTFEEGFERYIETGISPWPFAALK